MARRAQRQRGISLVELALVLPLLALLTFGVMEYGWLFTTTSQITNAARNGARIAIRPAATNGEVTARIDELMEAANLDESGYSVSLEPANVEDAEPGEVVTVTITVPYANVELTGFPLPTPENLVVSVSMAKEGPI